MINCLKINHIHMKNILLFAALFLTFSAFGQEDCKVLLEDLSGTYIGQCKNGLAHGKGIAKGKDAYKGRFKNGYPEGKGTYTYADSSVYKGAFRKGRREGRGNYEYMFDGQKQLKEGFWEDDVYVGPKKVKPYIVKMRRNLDRYNFYRVGDGNDVKIHLSQNGMNNSGVSDIMITASSGDEQSVAHNFGYNNVEFPFTCQVRYTSQNKLRTATHEVLFEFEIIKPGTWKVVITN